MPNFTTPVTRALNKEFKARLPEGLRIQAGSAGSFVSIRIEDPDGKISMRLFNKITERAGDLWVEAGLDRKQQFKVQSAYHFAGCVSTWCIH